KSPGTSSQSDTFNSPRGWGDQPRGTTQSLLWPQRQHRPAAPGRLHYVNSCLWRGIGWQPSAAHLPESCHPDTSVTPLLRTTWELTDTMSWLSTLTDRPSTSTNPAPPTEPTTASSPTSPPRSRLSPAGAPT